MGCLFAGKMRQAGVDVTIYNRKNDHTEIIKANGLELIEKDGTVKNIQLPVVTDPVELTASFDLMIVLVKSFATVDVLKQVKQSITDDTIVLSLQNGLGNLEKLQQAAPNSICCVGGTGSGASVIENGVIAHRAFGHTYIGMPSGQQKKAHDIAALLTASGLGTSVSDDIHSVIWSKLIVNIAYNGVTAISRLKNGDVASVREGQEIIKHLVEEAKLVADAEGITLLYDEPAAECVRMGIEDFYHNKSSMLSDMINERKTEIDSINGAIVKLGSKHSLATPYNEMITHLVKLAETTYQKRVVKL